VILLTVLIALGLFHWCALPAFFHHYQWFFRWLDWLSSRIDSHNTGLIVVAGIGLPLMLLALCLGVLAYWGALWVSAAAIATLLFSFGYSDWVGDGWRLRTAWKNNDELAAMAIIKQWQPVTYHSPSELPWRQQVLAGVAYHGFERLFPVLFWFLCLGPVGAVLYRLSYVMVTYTGLSDSSRTLASKWLWLLEWPVLRILGITFALTGNFVGCFHQWRICSFCIQRTTPAVLSHYIQGALHSYDDSHLDDMCPVNRYSDQLEIRTVVALYSRTFQLWLCLIALLLVFIV